MWSRKSPVWCWLFRQTVKVLDLQLFSNWVFSKHVSVRNSRIYAPASFFSLPPRPQKFFMSYLDGGKEQSIGPSEHLVRLLFRKLATNMPCREQRRKNKSLSIWPKPRDTSIFTTQIQNFFQYSQTSGKKVNQENTRLSDNLSVIRYLEIESNKI